MASNRTNVRSYGNVERVSAGIDWLSISLPRYYENAAWWASKCFDTMKEVVNDGNRLKPFTLNGYYGQGAAGCFAGERPDSYYAQFAGSYADDSFWSLFREDAHVSRIDLRVDVRFAAYRPTIARKGYLSAIRANSKLPPTRQRKIYFVEGSD